VVALIFGLFPARDGFDYYRHLVIMALMWVVIGVSWNLLAGYTGQVLTSVTPSSSESGLTRPAWCTTQLDISPGGGLRWAVPRLSSWAMVMGWICFRLRGPYFALGHSGLAEIARLNRHRMESFLPRGMQGISSYRLSARKSPTTTSRLPLR